MGSAAAIRAFHRDAEITLLTTLPYADFARLAPYFDRVWIDERPRWDDPAGLLRLARKLRAGRFDRVYDLSTRTRSALYFRLMWRPSLEWSGIVRGASHRQPDTPERRRMHTLDREADQLHWAGIPGPIPAPGLSWAVADVTRFALPPDYVLLIPGGAPVVIGGPDERELGAAIAAAVPTSRDLTGQTDFADIVELARKARRAIGNDTGPMHLAAAAGAPATVLYSAASDPALTAPRGKDVVILRRDNLTDLAVDDVAATLRLA